MPDCTGFSLVIPFYNEGPNVRFVLDEAHRVLPGAEILAVDDASDDSTWTEMRACRGVRALRLTRRLGQSGAIYHGLRASRGPTCGLMDGDGQNDPAGFHQLLAELARGEADVVCGYRRRRNDTWNRRAASRIANGIRRSILHDGIRDTGCSQKVFPRSAVELLVPFRGMHRYLPAFFRSAGLRIAEVPVEHRPRRAGQSKYNNWNRALIGIHDLVGVRWLLRRRLPPAHLEESP